MLVACEDSTGEILVSRDELQVELQVGRYFGSGILSQLLF